MGHGIKLRQNEAAVLNGVCVHTHEPGVPAEGGSYISANAYGYPLGSGNGIHYIMELNSLPGVVGNRSTAIDFHGDDTYTDYGFRIWRSGDSGGANCDTWLIHRGTGTFRFIANEAGPITFSTTNIERMRINANGTIGIGVSGTTSGIVQIEYDTIITPLLTLGFSSHVAENRPLIRLGDDLEIWDCQIVNTTQFRGYNDPTQAAIQLGSTGPTINTKNTVVGWCLIYTGGLFQGPSYGFNSATVITTGVIQLNFNFLTAYNVTVSPSDATGVVNTNTRSNTSFRVNSAILSGGSFVGTNFNVGLIMVGYP